MEKDKEKDTFSLESSLQELRKILDEMQNGNLNFDENVALFTQGAGLIRDCRSYLDRSELMIRELIEGELGEGPDEAG